MIEKIFWNLRLKAYNLQDFWDQKNKLFEQLKQNAFITSNLQKWSVSLLWNLQPQFCRFKSQVVEISNIRPMSLKIILFQLHCSICSFELKNLANSRPSASNFKRFPRSLEQFFLSLGQNNFGNKIPFLLFKKKEWVPSSIYSWSKNHILEHEFFCLGRLGSSGQ